MFDIKWELIEENGLEVYEPKLGVVFNSKDLNVSYRKFLKFLKDYEKGFKEYNQIDELRTNIQNSKLALDNFKAFYKNNIPSQIQDLLNQNQDLINVSEYKLNYLEKTLKERENVLCFKISKNDLNNDNFLRKIQEFAKKVFKDNKQIKIIINEPITTKNNDAPVEYIFTQDEIAKIKNLNKSLMEQGMKNPIIFADFCDARHYHNCDESWSLDNVLKANNYIEDIAKEIKDKKLTPFESVLYIHSFIIKNFEYNYKEGEGNSLLKDAEIGRVIPDILSNGNIVCSGYASLFKAIIDKLDMPNLKCDIIGSEFYEKNENYDYEFGHCHNLIHIKDEQYNIDGHYMEDACWDSKGTNFNEGRGFSHCLFPVTDLQNIKYVYYFQKNNAGRLGNLVCDPEIIKEAESAGSGLGLIVSHYNNILNQLKNQTSELEENKKKVEFGSDIFKAYKNNSKPIPKKVYKRGMVSLYEKIEGKLSEKSALKIEELILNSKIFSALMFEENASTSFSKNNKYYTKKSLKPSNLKDYYNMQLNSDKTI